MRYLLVFLVALVLIWRWRTARTATLQKRPPPQETSGALTIVACTQCGVHVPIGDAVIGKKGAYCSAAHCQQSEA